MSLLIKKDRCILFMHIPKCGGSSVVEAFKNKGFSSHLEIRGLPPQKCLTASFQHQTPDILRHLVRQEHLEDIFVVVRNPYTRILSEFNWNFRKTEPSHRPDFDEWIAGSLKTASEDPHHADNHFRPAIDYIDARMPCKIFKIEDDLRLVCEHYLHEGEPTEHAELPLKKRAETFPHSKSQHELHFSKRSLEAINQFYQQDFYAFGYNMITTECDTNITNPYHKTIKGMNDERSQLAIAWRQKTLENLIIKLSQRVENLSALRESYHKTVASPNTQGKRQDYPYDLLCDKTLLRLNNLSCELTRVSDLNQEEHQLQMINELLRIIGNYRAQLIKTA